MALDGMTLGMALALIFFSMGLLWRARTLQNRAGLPDGDVIYDDTGAWYPNAETLVAQDFLLVGKPDYLVEQPNGGIIPVELKSGRTPDKPWEGHVLQLAAYCLLVDECYGVRPDFGILQYPDRAFAVDYTEELEEDLLDLLADMRDDTFEAELDRDHNDWHRCNQCSVRHRCVQRLG
ncbi:MAG: PD-(D/E)XK nuclease family protein [Anaerolineae bacterium]